MSARLRSRLAELDAQIAQQRRHLGELEQIRSNVERELHATAMFPVLTLPAEITTEIFLRCLPLAPLCIPRGQYSAPVVLASVCQAWRDITFAAPALWSKLDIRLDDVAHWGKGLVGDLADLWLSRAQNCPLTLEFTRFETEFPLKRLRKIIDRWSPQVQYLHLDLAGDDPVNIRTLGLDSASFPLLQSATVDCVPHSYPTPTILFGSAPLLHTLCMPSAASNEFTLPSMLTKFEGKLHGLELLTLAPNLIELICKFNRHDSDRSVTITHRNLASLTFTANNVEDYFCCDDILPHLALPALKHLDVSGIESYDSLESFITRSSPPLVSLSVKGNTVDSDFDHLRKNLSLVADTLESLEFVDIADAHFSSLVYFLRRYSYNIRALTFRDVHGSSGLDLLVRFLYEHSARLRTFRLVCITGPFFDDTICAGPSKTIDRIDGHLSRLAQAGMDIYLGATSKRYGRTLWPNVGSNSWR
ncbi:hypothetical protein C8R45DRAFT_956270 [Mycena sanguinolenta]|nr:hypothetical protein C8R45DRAFT_956270 [Mycena sanguinolenta]